MDVKIAIGGQEFDVSCGGTWVEWNEEAGQFVPAQSTEEIVNAYRWLASVGLIGGKSVGQRMVCSNTLGASIDR